MRYQEIILETTEENQIINLIAGRMAEQIATLADSGKPQTIRASKLTPSVDSSAVSDVLNKLDISLMYKPNTDGKVQLGGYVPEYDTIQLNMPDIKTFAKHTRKQFTDVIRGTLVHELQHAIDDLKSSGKFISGNNAIHSSDDDYQGYLNSPHEINARASEFLLDMSAVIANWKKQGIEISTNDLTRLIKQKLSSNRLSDIDPEKLKRLYTRAYKFYRAELDYPKSVEPDTLVSRAKKWILGGGQGKVK